MTRLRDNCGPERRKECVGGKNASVCDACPRKVPYVPTAWFSHIWFLYSLQKSGFPFGKDDMTIAEWFAVGEMKLLMETPRMPDGK